MDAELGSIIEICCDARSIAGTRKREIDRSSLNPEKICALAINHKVGTTLYGSLSAFPPLIAAGISAGLKKHVVADVMIKERMIHDWMKIVNRFRDLDVPLITLKGPALSIQLYGDPRVREYGDLDFFLDLGDHPRLISIMEGMGYTLKDEQRRMMGILNDRRTKSVEHLEFSEPRNAFRVEFHDFSLMGELSYSAAYKESILSRAREVEWKGFRFLTMPLADHALFAISHGMEHAWGLLHWLLDAAIIFAQQDDNFCQEIAGEIRRRCLERELLVTERVLGIVLGLKSPSWISEIKIPRFFDPTGPSVFCYMTFLSSGKIRMSIMGNLKKVFLFEIPVAKNFDRKVQFLFAPLRLRKEDIADIDLPEELFFLYFLVRPIFMLRRKLSVGRT